MIDQEMNLPAPGSLEPSDRLVRTADIGQALAAVLATTRREWMSPRPESPAPDEAAVNRVRFAHPLIRFALDAKRSNSWRARIGRQAWIQSVVQLAELDRTPEGTP